MFLNLYSFSQECQNKIGDKLGLHSLLTEPFQRFFKYQNLLESVLKKAEKKELNFMEIAATSKALHNVKKLLNTANKSMALTEVVDSKVYTKFLCIFLKSRFSS